MFILALSAALISNWYSIERSREQLEARLQQVAEQTDRIERVEEARAEADARPEAVEQLNQHLETKVDAYSTTMARAADRVLTARLDTESDSEAMTRIGEAFKEMIDEIDAAMGNIQTFSREVSVVSEQTTTGVTGPKKRASR